MLQYFADTFIRFQFVRVQPDSLTHQERIVVNFLSTLNLESSFQLVNHEFQFFIKLLIKSFHISVRI